MRVVKNSSFVFGFWYFHQGKVQKKGIVSNLSLFLLS